MTISERYNNSTIHTCDENMANYGGQQPAHDFKPSNLTADLNHNDGQLTSHPIEKHPPEQSNLKKESRARYNYKYTEVCASRYAHHNQTNKLTPGY